MDARNLLLIIIFLGGTILLGTLLIANLRLLAAILGIVTPGLFFHGIAFFALLAVLWFARKRTQSNPISLNW